MCKFYDAKRRKFRYYLRHKWVMIPAAFHPQNHSVCMRCGAVR